MTADEIIQYGIPIDANDNMKMLAIGSGLAWIERNTTFRATKGKELPDNVKLFLLKFAETMTQDGTIASESLGGMSQSFSAGDKAGLLLRQYAAELLGEWYSSVKISPAVKRWG